MEFKNEELEKEIDLFFNESKENLDQILDELGLDAKQVCPDESEQFLVKRAEILKNFEKYLFKKCTILKDLEQNENDLNDLLIEKINNLVNDEKNVNSELKKLETEKENLREMLEVKSNLIKESIDKKKEVERICNGNVKEEFVSLCKFMNLKFQWNQTNKKFTIGKIN